MPGSSVSRWWHTPHGRDDCHPPVLHPDLHSSHLGLALSGTECFPDMLTLGLAVCLSVASGTGPGVSWPAPNLRRKTPCLALLPLQSAAPPLGAAALSAWDPRTNTRGWPQPTTHSLPGTQ